MDDSNQNIQKELKIKYRNLKKFYEQLPRDNELESYSKNFSFTDVVEKIYAVGSYCWFISDMKKGRFMKIGGAFEKLTGYKPEEFTNASFIQAARFTSPNHLLSTLTAAEQFWQYFYLQPKENRKHIKSSHTYAFVRKNETIFHALQQSSTVFFDKEGNGVYQFDLITDITHLDPQPKLRFFLLDTSDMENMKNIPIHDGIIRKTNEMPISPAEMKVLDLIAKGKSIKQIAADLNLSENTIKHHRTNMFAKCNVGNMAELTAKALQSGWFLANKIDKNIDKNLSGFYF